MIQQATSLKRTARLAGLLYLIMAITSFYAIMYVPSHILVKGDIAATTNNMLTHELLFRSGIVSDLINAIVSLFLAFTLYRLFNTVDVNLATLLVAFVLIEIPIFFLLETFNLTSLILIKGEVFKSFTHEQTQDAGFLFLKMYGYGTMTLEVFFGLWLIPFGLLIIKSRFIPRVIGVLMLIAGAGYTVDSLISLLFPLFSSITKPVAFTFSGIGEIITMLWLLIKGVKEYNPASVSSEDEKR
jgi:hypothetical protein